MKKIIFLLFFVFLTNINSQNRLHTSDYSEQVKWVDSVYNSLSVDEKIGQLFFVQANSFESNNSEKVKSLIKKQNI